jgi:hypothetical protein
MSTYLVLEAVPGPVGKFACKVSFNGKAAEYYEVDLDPSVDGATHVAAVLKKVADDDEAATEAKAASDALSQQIANALVG